METENPTIITVETTINAPIEKVWKFWSEPAHIVNWNNASDDWYTPRAENDLQVGGNFNARMEARDGSFGFDFEGTYTDIIIHKRIEYAVADGRKVKILFSELGNETKIIESFEAENTHPIEVQKGGWQSILNSFKKYTESKTS